MSLGLAKSQWSEAFRVPAEHIWSVRPTICHDEYFGKWPRLALVASITNFSYVRYHFGEPLHASWHALTPLAVMARRGNRDWLDKMRWYSEGGYEVLEIHRAIDATLEIFGPWVA